MYKFISYAAAFIALVSCAGKGAQERDGSLRRFPLVNVPVMISDAGAASDYVAVHFWDEFLKNAQAYRNDESAIGGVAAEEVEAKVGEWSDYLLTTPLETAWEAMDTMMDKLEACEKKDTSSTVFESMTKLLAKYLYDPNSPVRNEDVYCRMAQRMAESDCVPQMMKMVWESDASLSSLNRTGTKAADISFSLLSGKKMTLHSVKADYILLFFSNPGCTACKEIGEKIEASATIQKMLKTSALKIVNVYIDQEYEKWREYAASYPKEWISGFDYSSSVRENLTYNIRAIPSLYLLDAEKKVIIKDGYENIVIGTLDMIGKEKYNIEP